MRIWDRVFLLLLACAGGCTLDVPGQIGAIPPSNRPSGQSVPRVMLDLGISVASAERGILVAQVQPGGPAELAGLRVGDILTELDGGSLEGVFPPDFLRNVNAVPAGGIVTLKVLRDGATFTRKAVNGVGLPNLDELTARANRDFDTATLPPAPASAPTPLSPGSVAKPAPPAVVEPPAGPPVAAVRSPTSEASRPLLLMIRRLTVTPESVAPGARFTLDVAYTAPVAAPVGFSFVISTDGRELFASKPEEIQGGAGAPMVYSRMLGAAAEPGTYRIRVRLAQGDEAVERSVPFNVAPRESNPGAP